MASNSNNVYCSCKCLPQEELKMTTFWCTSCNKPLCDSCHGNHNLNHHVILQKDNDLLESIGIPFNTYCYIHEREMDIFCSSHDNVICVTCMQTEHSTCDSITSLDEAAKNAKSSTMISVLQQDIQDMIKSLKEIIESREAAKTCLEQQTTDIIEKIKDIRRFINDRLDQIEAQVAKNLNEEYRKQVEETERTIEQLGHYQKEYIEMEANIDTIKQYASNMQTFVGLRELEVIFSQKEEKLTSFIGLIKNFQIDFEQDHNILSACSLIKSFGRISTSVSDPKYRLSRKSVQIPLFLDYILVSGQTEFFVTKSVKLPQESLFKPIIILSCAILPNGQYIFIDSSNKRLILLENDGSHAKSKGLKEKAFDIAVLGNDKIALSFPWSSHKRVEIINTINYKQENVISFTKRCYGISYYQGGLYVVVKSEGILVMDLGGQLWTSLPIEGSGIFYVHVDSEKIFCSDEQNDTVRCFDTKGNSIWTCRGDNLRSPRSISSGKHHIFVACAKSNAIVVLDNNGNILSDILNPKFNNPTSVFFDKESECLLSSNSSNRQAFLYEKI